MVLKENTNETKKIEVMSYLENSFLVMQNPGSSAPWNGSLCLISWWLIGARHVFICVDKLDFSYLCIGFLCQRRPFFLSVDVCVKCSQFASFLLKINASVEHVLVFLFFLLLTLWSWERNPWSPFCSHLEFSPQVWFMGFKKEKAHFFLKAQIG